MAPIPVLMIQSASMPASRGAWVDARLIGTQGGATAPQWNFATLFGKDHLSHFLKEAGQIARRAC